MNDESKYPLLDWIVAIFVIYIIAADMRFRFEHPWMTETELFLHLWDSFLWRTIPH